MLGSLVILFALPRPSALILWAVKVVPCGPPPREIIPLPPR
jgi:hypothetical protein